MTLWCCIATPPNRSDGTLTITPLKIDTGVSAGAPGTRNEPVKTVTNQGRQNPERVEVIPRYQNSAIGARAPNTYMTGEDRFSLAS